MDRIALITDRDHPGLRPDDVPLPSAFRALGLDAEPVAWGHPIDPSRFALAVLRTPWDYFERIDEFRPWLHALALPVLNDPRFVEWNHHKGYLLELEEEGAALLPATSLLLAAARPGRAEVIREALGEERFVLKPAVSGGAWRTRVVDRDDELDWSSEDVGDFLAQAFVPEIEASGEWSVMLFGGEPSHCIRKTPAKGDFRVQAEHGGAVHPEALPDALRAAALRVVRSAERIVARSAAAPGTQGVSVAPLAYARVDFVWDGASEPILMELELIEPELFLRCDAGAAERFARAVSERLG